MVNRYFTGAVTRIEGLGLDEIAREVLAKHAMAFRKKEVDVERLARRWYLPVETQRRGSLV